MKATVIDSPTTEINHLRRNTRLPLIAVSLLSLLVLLAIAELIIITAAAGFEERIQ